MFSKVISTGLKKFDLDVKFNISFISSGKKNYRTMECGCMTNILKNNC